jgi:hypothetical protein
LQACQLIETCVLGETSFFLLASTQSHKSWKKVKVTVLVKIKRFWSNKKPRWIFCAVLRSRWETPIWKRREGDPTSDVGRCPKFLRLRRRLKRRTDNDAMTKTMIHRLSILLAGWKIVNENKHF